MSGYFQDALNKAHKQRDIGGRRHDAVYASDAGIVLQIGDERQVHGSCLRKQYYRITETPQSDPEDPRQNFVTGVGEAVHEQVAAVYKAAEMLVKAEMRLWISKIKLSGRIDLIIRPDKKLVGVEVKSIGGYYNTLGAIRGTRNVPFAPKIGHLCQTVVYAQHMHEQTNGEMDEWILHYVDRESGNFAEHMIRYVNDQEVWVNGEPSSVTPERIYSRWDELWKHIANQSLPDRDYEIQYSEDKIKRLCDAGRLNKKDTAAVKAGKNIDKGDNPCRLWCQWRTRCWTED